MKSPLSFLDKVEKRVSFVVRDGIKYSRHSDRGRAVIEEMRREKSRNTQIPVSILLATSIIGLSLVFA